VVLPELPGINVDESIAEATSDWNYWLAQGYSFEPIPTRLRPRHAYRNLTEFGKNHQLRSVEAFWQGLKAEV